MAAHAIVDDDQTDFKVLWFGGLRGGLIVSAQFFAWELSVESVLCDL